MHRRIVGGAVARQQSGRQRLCSCVVLSVAFIVVGLAFGLQSAMAASFGFAPKADLATGAQPEAVAAGDLNGDGSQDLVVADGEAGTVSVLLGKGDGTFAPRVDYAAGAAPAAVALADLNGDKKLDLVVVDKGSNTVSVLLGKGDGTFEAGIEYATGASPDSVAIGDVNGDGKQDLVVADGEGNAVSVLLGKGDGTFEPKVDYATGTAPDAVALVDLNGDKKQDVVVANGGANSVSVLLGRGDGTFEAGVEYATAAKPAALAAADLNGDGKQDVVVADSEANAVSVLLGNGNGTLAARHDFPTGASPRAVALGDLNADGKQDVVVASSGAGSASVLLGKGDGTLGSKQDFATGTGPRGVALADLNGDHKPDIVTANASANSASVLLNTSVAAIETSAGSLTFAGQLFATKSPAQKVTVTNTGAAALPISSVTVTGNFAASGCSGSSLAPGASCSISFTFTPKGYGSLKGEATISSGAGSKVVKLAGTGLPPAALVTTGPVGEIAGSYATLTGTVVSQGPGSFYFQYGPTKSYGSVTPTLPLSSSTSPQLLASTLLLTAGSTYHYRLIASNLLGTVAGADRVFTIPPEPALLRLLRHGRLAAVLQHGLRVRVSDSSPAVITLKLRVDAAVARATHLISSRSRRKTKVTVGTLRVTVAANRGRTVTIHFGGAAKRSLALLGRLKVTILATVSTANGVAGEATTVRASIRR